MKTDKKIYALGFFDGVHLGHQVLLRECRNMAKELGCVSAAITFDRHPKSLFMDNPPKLIVYKRRPLHICQRQMLLHG